MTAPRKRASPVQRRRSAPSHSRARSSRAAHTEAAERDEIIPRDPDVTEAIALDAARHLLGQDEYKGFLRSDAEVRIAFLRNRIVANHKLSRAQHISLLADAYALYAQLRSDPSVQHAVLEAARKLDRNLDERTTALRLVLELTITYGGKEGEGDERRAGKLYSRDAAAITNLIRRGVAPSQVVALGTEKGEGLYRWATWRPEAESYEHDAPTGEDPAPKSDVSSPEPQPAPSTPDAAIEEAIRDQDESGAILRRGPASGKRVQLRAPRASSEDAKMVWPGEWPNEIVRLKIMPNGQRLLMNRIRLDGRSDEQIEAAFATLAEEDGIDKD